jgi:hypothetical protein
MMAVKSFRPSLKNLEEIQHWATILGTELYTRVMDDFELNQRWPKNLVVCIIKLLHVVDINVLEQICWCLYGL